MGIISLLLGEKYKKGDYEAFLNRRAPIRNIPARLQSDFRLKVSGNHAYLEAGKGKPVIFCHGLFGGIYNIDVVAEAIANDFYFIMPYLPMYDLALNNCSIKNLGDYLASFIHDMGLEEAVVIASSMGGGASLYYALQENHRIKALVLCGSSGLSNIPLSKGYFKRKDFDFVAMATQDIFFDKNTAGREMITDVFNALQSYEVVLRSVRFTKAARIKMDGLLPHIHVPVLLVWGEEDPITPVDAAFGFHRLLPNSRLEVLPNCGHVPTQEKPVVFLNFLKDFFKQIDY